MQILTCAFNSSKHPFNETKTKVPVSKRHFKYDEDIILEGISPAPLSNTKEKQVFAYVYEDPVCV